MDSQSYSYKTFIFTLGAPLEEVQGRQTKLHPGFTRKKHQNDVFGRTYPRSAGGAKAKFCQIKDVSSSKILEPTPPCYN